MKKLSILLLMLFTFCANILSVNALDFTKKGSIEITLIEKEEQTKINGAELTIYKIADAKEENHNLVFEYVNELSDCKVSLDNLDNDNISEKINKCLNDSVKGISLVTEDGKVNFEDLDLGLYLVKQTNKVEGYSVITPYLVMIPRVINDEWTYNVTSKPKTDIIRVIDLKVTKVWNKANSNISSSINLPKEIEIELSKNGEVIDTVKLNSANNWEYTWKDLEKSDMYNVREVNVPKGYTVTYQKEGNLFIVTNTTSLVQTGNMPWLVEIIGGIGLIFIVISLIYNKNEQKS